MNILSLILFILIEVIHIPIYDMVDLAIYQLNLFLKTVIEHWVFEPLTLKHLPQVKLLSLLKHICEMLFLCSQFQYKIISVIVDFLVVHLSLEVFKVLLKLLLGFIFCLLMEFLGLNLRGEPRIQ